MLKAHTRTLARTHTLTFPAPKNDAIAGVSKQISWLHTDQRISLGLSTTSHGSSTATTAGSSSVDAWFATVRSGSPSGLARSSNHQVKASTVEQSKKGRRAGGLRETRRHEAHAVALYRA